MQYVTLTNGIEIPQLGLGLYNVPKQECERCVLNALKVGYRHFDTAQTYHNESEVGNAIIKSGIPRTEIFITSKIWITNYGYEKAKQSVLNSLQKLQTNYIDLMLLHEPYGDYYGAWRALEDLYDEGKLKSIGISNFHSDRMVDLSIHSRIKPMVNQIELNPFNQQIESQKWNDKYKIVTEAWAQFAEGINGLFSNNTIAEIAKKYDKTVAQVVLRWEIQRGVVVIPKTVHEERMKENFDVFDFCLDDGDMKTMETLDQKKSPFLSHDDPRIVEEFLLEK